MRIQCVDSVVLADDEQKLPMGFWRLPEQRLRIDVSVDVAIEARIDMNPMRLFPSEAGHDVGSIPIRRAVIIQDRLSTGHRTEQKSYANGASEPEMPRHGTNAYDPAAYPPHAVPSLGAVLGFDGFLVGSQDALAIRI